MEQVINQTLDAYALTIDNKFKLAAYTELKGRYSSSVNTLYLNFGELGYLSFFENNCLFRTMKNQVFHLNRQTYDSPEGERLNEELAGMFEHIIMLGNHHADTAHINFVDRHLASKNIEPFEKIFIRHILIKYGKYDSERQMVNFHTDWLPQRTYSYRRPSDQALVKRYITPLNMRLEKKILRGYYIKAGGTVYVEDVDRDVFYATGEQYDYNVSAFKLFAQKLFVQTVQYITKSEARRLQESNDGNAIITQMVTAESPISKADKFVVGKMRKTQATKTSASGKSQVKPLYHAYSWIPMMLSIMRISNINIGDEDIIIYFIDAPYFDKVYRQLTDEEKRKVDAYRKNL